MRSQSPDRLNAPAAVRLRYHLFRREPMCKRPFPPDSSYGRSGINQHSIEIEQNCLAEENHQTE
jgi:hypothetical protein